MTAVKPRLPVSWISDDKISKCTICQSDFSMLNRRHHCRSCGNIFCNYCCFQFHSLPSYLPSTHSRYCDGKRHRVCNTCVKEITMLKRNKNMILIFSLLPLPIKDMFVIREICQRWKIAIDSIISVFKSIHLKIGYQKWSSVERRIICTHWKEFTGHSRLMIQSVRALFGIVDIAKMIRYYKTHGRKYSCTYLFCNCQCSQHINHYDLMDTITCFPTSQILEIQEMEVWIGQTIVHVDKKWLKVLTTWLLQPFHPPSNPLQRIIANNLLPVICDDIEMTFHLYFSCNFLIESKTSHYIYYRAILNRLLHMTPFRDELEHSHTFLAKIKYPNQITEYMFDKTRLPFDPNTTIRDVQVVNIRRLSTFTKPWVVPIDTYERGTIHILIKHDDLRKDQFVMNIVSMLKYVDSNIKLDTYNVLPVNDTYGIIEMLQGAVTLQEINKTMTLTNWVVQNNLNETMMDIRNNFISSCASNCILSFMMGVGDRNLGNILVSKNGNLSHIDFSYILGTDPKWEELTEMRITPGMVDLLGGTQSQQFMQLKQECTAMFSNIKHYTYFWYALFRYLATCEPPIEPHYRRFDAIELHVEKRLMPEADDEIVSMTIMDIVEKNSGSRVAGWVDSMHSIKSSIEDLLFHISIS